MRGLNIISFIAAIAALSACSDTKKSNAARDTTTNTVTTKKNQTETLIYTIRTVREQANDCKNSKDENCSYAEIKYPVFTDHQKLNDNIRQMLIFICDGRTFKSSVSINDAAKDFISEYYAAKKDGLDPNRAFQLDASATIAYQDPQILAIEVGNEGYSGGAHGYELKYFVNWDKKNDKPINLSDILIDGYKDKLTKIAEKLFRKEEKLNDTVPFTDYHLTNGKFVLNNNFYITDKGISFFYNDYEIKPYSEGPTDLLIPYQSIITLMRKNTVISQYIK